MKWVWVCVLRVSFWTEARSSLLNTFKKEKSAKTNSDNEMLGKRGNAKIANSEGNRGLSNGIVTKQHLGFEQSEFGCEGIL